MINKLITATDSNIMNFGKHRGERLEDVPDKYIKYMCEETDFLKECNDDTERGSIARYFKLAYGSIVKGKK